MANIYVRSTDGSDSDNGSTWALAKATLAGAAAIDAAGDTIFLSQSHSESTAASISHSIAGTLASPVNIICGNDAAEPPTAVSTAAIVATGNGAYNITNNGIFHCYGVKFRCAVGNTATSAQIILAPNLGDHQVYWDCEFRVAQTLNSALGRIIVGGNIVGANLPTVVWNDCDVHFGAALHNIDPQACAFRWSGGSILAGSAAITLLFKPNPTSARAANVLVEGVDLSNADSGVNLVDVAKVTHSQWVFRSCKLPSAWSGTLITGSWTHPSQRVALWNCSASDTNYAMWVEDYSGSTKHDTGIYRTSGATDGDTNISWKMATSADAEYPAIILRSPEIFVPNTTVAVSKTLTVEIAQDGTTTALNDNEIWLEVQYLGTSNFPKSVFIDDAKADVLATAAAQTDSSEAWTGLSGTNKKQKLSVTFTPQEEGVYIATVCVAKASTTVYVDPLVTVS